MKKKVYVAGPYIKGDMCENIHRAISTGDKLITRGFVPYIPHLCHYWNIMYWGPEEQWLQLSMEWLDMCDAVLRIPGDSAGADAEVERAKTLGIPVFYTINELADELE